MDTGAREGEGEEDERVGWIVRVTLKRIHDSM